MDQDMIAHLPYSPDLAPADFFLFPLLKSKLRGVHHRNLPTVKAAVRNALKSIPEERFQQALTDLTTRWRKCIAAEGEYFEGCGIVPNPDPYFDQVNDTTTDSEQESKIDQE